jgi:hypothetical protein
MDGSPAQGACPHSESLQFVLSYKRLDAGTFRLPTSPDPRANSLEIDERTLEALLNGIDIDAPVAKPRQQSVH